MGQLAEGAMSIPTPVIEAMYERLGGAKTLDHPIRSEADLARLAIKGLPLRAFRAIRTAGFSEHELAAIIPPRTLRHRVKKKEPLNPVETERAIRLLSIEIQAELVLEDKEKARRWLRKPIRILDGMTPLEAAQTEHGAEVVREMLGSMAWGAVA
jgi:putative toxin-antitoxin system antitoxin component (TIGR02293 family)